MDVRTTNRHSNLILTALVCVTACVAISCNGCSKGEKESKNPVEAVPKNQVAAKATSQMLVGTWYGRAQVDKALLASQLESIANPASRAALENVARIFETTEIGAQFGLDGTMLIDIQILANGQTLRDNAQGTWQMIDAESDAITVETNEVLPTGGTETNRMRYQFTQEGQIAIMVAPTSEALAKCNPVFVFERVQESATIADRAGNSALK